MPDRPDSSEYMDRPIPPRCEGSGEIQEVVDDRVDHRDPSYETVDWPCPGCVDCLMGEIVTQDELEILDQRPEQVVIRITDIPGLLRVVGEGEDKLAEFAQVASR